MSKLQDCLNEIERLQKSLHQKSSKLEQLQARLEGEQELTRELRMENNQLKTEMTSIKSDSDSKDEKIEDLRSHIRYVKKISFSLNLNLKKLPLVCFKLICPFVGDIPQKLKELKSY